MFTRQHYKAIAEMIGDVCLMAAEPNGGTVGTVESRKQLRAGADIARHQIANDLIDYFAKDNPRFDRDKFLETCGL